MMITEFHPGTSIPCHFAARPVSALAMVILISGVLSGCRDDSITYHESVPVTRKLDGDELNDGELKYRMITAIADQPTATWFFKLSGPIADVERSEEAWSTFLKTIRFESDEPTWVLPEGWSSVGFEDRSLGGGMVMRIANINTAVEQVAISVSSMPAGQQLLPNVNRWRGQLGLRPVDGARLLSDLSDLETEHASFKLFDAQGPILSTRMGGGPFSGRGNAAKAANRPPGLPIAHGGSTETPGTTDAAGTEEPSESDIKFDEPKDWISGSSSTMVVGRWNRESESGAAELMLLTMRPSEESWSMNVEAWARQVNADEVADVEMLTEKIQVAGTDSRKVQLYGPEPEDAAKNPAVVAVMFQTASGSGYVLKLSGNQSAVADAADDFQTFLDSISFLEPGD